MEVQVNIRPAVLRKIDSLLTLQRQSLGASAWTGADYAGLLPQQQTILLLAEAESENRAAGFVLGRVLADEMEILNLAVAPDRRRRGFGRRLVAEATAQARARGAARCWLEVRTSNQAALRFYRALGFVEQGRRRNYYRDPVEDAAVCMRRLGPPAPRQDVGPAP